MPEFFIGSDDKQNLAKIINGALQAANFADETLDFRYDADGLGMWAEQTHIECDTQEGDPMKVWLDEFAHNDPRVPTPSPVDFNTAWNDLGSISYYRKLYQDTDSKLLEARERAEERLQEIRTLRAEVKKLNGKLRDAETAITRHCDAYNKACEENRHLRQELSQQNTEPKFEILGFKRDGKFAAEYQLCIEKAFLIEKNVWRINVLLPR